MSKNRLPVFPSRMNHQLMKNRLVGAKKGYDLLKKKSDALKNKIRRITKLIYDTKLGMGDSFRDAVYSHTQAVYFSKDLK